MSFEVPEPNAVETAEMSDGARILLRRHGNPDGARLVLSHGNGLAIDAYLPFWGLLLDRYDLVLFDARNHGRNPVHDFAAHNWARIGRDMDELQAAIARFFGDKPAIGVFHSLTSKASVQQALKAGATWSRLVLFDPPVYPPPGHALVPVHEEHLNRMERLARRRPQRYADPSEFSATLQARPQFARWVPGAHDLFARTTLRRQGDDGWWLACPREYEAHIFLTDRDSTIWTSLLSRSLDIPLAVIGADPELPDADSPAKVCRALSREAGLPYECITDTTHMLQLERPEACAEALERAIGP